MQPLKILKRVSLSSFWLLIKIGLRYPMAILPTLSATKVCMQTADQWYGKAHHLNGKANAFRHAYWNYCIAKNCYNKSYTIEHSLQYSKWITDWHEKAFPNRDLPRAMDLHNNKIGRLLFKSHPNLSLEQAAEKCRILAEQSVFIKSVPEIKNIKNQMVHIVK
ncbi:hypothetical protein [Flavobacterium sp. ASW18X]|uniref:DUF6973 domain-containing protein n=1 Tax=Flavobacterium sp. ASW18X TaxID=2572595 RepID=UPI00146E6E01|nr:hypothetical protein [Flavobacterium sp. ASW18X]